MRFRRASPLAFAACPYRTRRSTALVDRLRDALAREDLSRQIHALRVYVARVGERVLSNEVLLDGEPWAAGEALCRAHAWPSSERLWGTRLFVALVPAE